MSGSEWRRLRAFEEVTTNLHYNQLFVRQNAELTLCRKWYNKTPASAAATEKHFLEPREAAATLNARPDYFSLYIFFFCPTCVWQIKSVMEACSEHFLHKIHRSEVGVIVLHVNTQWKNTTSPTSVSTSQENCGKSYIKLQPCAIYFYQSHHKHCSQEGLNMTT